MKDTLPKRGHPKPHPVMPSNSKCKISGWCYAFVSLGSAGGSCGPVKMIVMPPPNCQQAMCSRDWILHKNLSFIKGKGWNHMWLVQSKKGILSEVGWGLSLPISGKVSWIDLTRIWVKNFLVHCALWVPLYPLWESTKSLSSTALWSGLWEDAPSWGL